MNHDPVQVSLAVAADKTAVSEKENIRHVVFTVTVSRPITAPERQGLAVALTLDRSGSMHGGKIEAAKQAAHMVIQALDDRDEASIVCFDEKIDVLLPKGPVNGEYKKRAEEALRELQARGSTALHEGWLTGCRSIAAGGKEGASLDLFDPEPSGSRIGHCFLLTDGLANVGEQDPEAIASQAAAVRIETGIRTSTFGIGEDYDEALLAPMAVAGGGQFHHLRSLNEIVSTFTGELGELFQAAARNVRIEIAQTPGISLEAVSDYFVRVLKAAGGGPDTAVADVGDLMPGEERRIVLRLRFAGFAAAFKGVEKLPFQCRLKWEADGSSHETAMGEIVFEKVKDEVCEAFAPDRDVLHWVGLHHAARTERLVMGLLRDREAKKARKLLDTALGRLKGYAGKDKDLLEAIRDLDFLIPLIDAGEVDSMTAKESLFMSQSFSRGQRDLRGGKAT